MAKKISQEYVLKVVAEGLSGVTKQLKELNSNLTGAPEQFNKVDKAQKKAAKSGDKYATNLKGTAQATNNSTKAFSKMQEGMVGSLVPAYATVAANVFALTAAFGALERAADLQILIKSADTLATQTGRSISALSAEMKELTGNAISMKEAMVSASIASSAGFDDTTIKQLTTAARNASVALGREMTDALNRVFKGAIKAEPELLDELGIILRLEPATKKYAAAIGKSVKDLTTFEKQQAIVNEVLEQADEKFGKLSEVETNPYSQLSSSIVDLTNSLLGFINTPIGYIISALTNNVGLLALGFAALAKNIIGLAAPALSGIGAAFKSFAQNVEDTASEMEAVANARIQGWDPDVIQAGDAALDQYAHTVEKVTGYEKSRTKVLNDNVKVLDKNKAAVGGLNRILGQLRKGEEIPGLGIEGSIEDQINSVTAMRDTLVDTQKEMTNTASIADKSFGWMSQKVADVAEGFNTMTKSTISSYTAVSEAKGFTDTFRASIDGLTASIFDQVKADSMLGAATLRLGRVMGTVAGTVAALSMKVLGMLPMIGAAMVAWQMFTGVLHKVGFTDLNAAMDKQEKALKETTNSLKEYVKEIETLPDSIEGINRKLDYQANVLSSITSNLNEAMKEIELQGGFDVIDRLFGALNFGSFETFRENLDSIQKNLSSLGFDNEIQKQIEKYGNTLSLSRDKARELGKELRALNEELNRNAQGAKENIKLYTETFEELDKNLTAIDGTRPALNEIEKSLLGVSNILSQSMGKDISTLVTGLETLGSSAIAELNMSDLVSSASDANAQLENILEVRNSLREQEEKASKLKNYIPGAFDQKEGLRIALEEVDKLVIEAEESLQSFSDKINEALDDATSRFNAISRAKDKFEKDQLSINIQGLDDTAGLENRISLANKSAQNELQNIETIKDREENRYEETEASIAKIDKQMKDLEARKLSIDLDSEGAKADILEIDSELGVLGTRLRGLNEFGMRLKKTVSESENKSIAVLQGQFSTLYKELGKISRLASSSDYFADQADSIRSNLLPVIDELKAKFSEDKEIQDFLNNFIKGTEIAQQRMAAFAGTGLESTGTSAGDLAITEQQSQALQNQIDLKNRELELNELLGNTLSERLDKTHLINHANLESQLQVAGQQEDLALIISLTNQIALNEQARLQAIKEESNSIKRNAELEKKGLLAVTRGQKQRLDIEKKLAGFDKGTKEYEDLKDILTDINKLSNSLELGKVIGEAADSMNSLAESSREMTAALLEGNALESTVAGLKSMQALGADMGGSFGQVAQGLATVSLSMVDYQKKLEENKEIFKDDPASKALADQQAGLQAVQNAAGAMAGAFDEGSNAAKAFTLVQQGVAIANAAASIANAASSGDPYTAPARVAAMMSLMTAVLGAAQISFSSSSGGQSAQEKRTEAFGSDNLLNSELKTNAFEDSLVKLVDVDTKLFSATRDLQISIVNLNKTFDSLGYILSPSFKGDTGSVTSQFGAELPNDYDNKAMSQATLSLVSAVSAINPLIGALAAGATLLIDNIGGWAGDAISGFFGSVSYTDELLEAGLRMSATISTVGDELVGSFDELNAYGIVEITKKTKKYWRSSYSTWTETMVEALGPELGGALSDALDMTMDVATKSIKSFSEVFGGDTSLIFDRLSNFNILPDDLKLLDLDDEEAAEAISSYFNSVLDTTLNQALPWISKFSIAGEEIADTMARLTSNGIAVSNSLSKVGISITDFVSDSISISKADMRANMPKFKGRFGSAIGKIMNHAVDNMDMDQALNNLKMQLAVEWNESLLSNFKDVDEFQGMFDSFLTGIFDEAELLEFQMQNADIGISNGFKQLISQFTAMGETDLVDIINQGGFNADTLKDVFQTGMSTGAFDTSGSGDTAGADALATIVQSGSIFGSVAAAAEAAADKIYEFEKALLRQIEAFGLAGKELALLRLDFDYQDSLEEAAEIGADIALVEKAFGLERLQIIKDYNEEIVDSIEDSFSGLSEATLEIAKSMEDWDDVLYLSKRIDITAKSLAKSLSGVDLSIFDLDTVEKLPLEELLDLSVVTPEDINAQINLVNELKDSIIERYNIEAAAIQDLEDNLRSLSFEIRGFLDELVISDISPLTNAEKLEEAQNQFTTNLSNVLSDDVAVSEAAQGSLLDSAQALLDQASLFYSIGPAFEDIFNNVYDSLNSLDSDILDQLNMTSDDVQSQALLELSNNAIEQLAVLDNVLYTLEAQNTSNLESEIQALGTDITSHLGFILDKLDAINDSSWQPLVNILSGLNSYAVGTDEVQHDQLAMIHKGEAILTADAAESVRSGNSVVSNNYSTNSDNSDVVAAIRTLTEVLVQTQTDVIEQSARIEKATKNIKTETVKVSNTRGLI